MEPFPLSPAARGQAALAKACIVVALLAMLFTPAAMFSPSNAEAEWIDDSGQDEPPLNAVTYGGLSGGFFTENLGQVTEPVRFYSTGNPAVAMRDDGVMFVFRQNVETAGGRRADTFAYLMKFVGARPVIPTARSEFSFTSNFFLGNDESRWMTGVRSYGEVAYESLYDGIDLVFRGDSRGAKYDFVVRPRADIGRIRITFDGVEGIDVGGNAIKIRMGAFEMSDSVPRSYSVGGGAVDCRFEPLSYISYGFRCGERDLTKTLVIDPLVYSTYLGGSQTDYSNSIKADSVGNAYVAGQTSALDFPVTPGSYQTTATTGGSAFVSKILWNGTGLIYSTYLGGSGRDVAYSVAIDTQLNAYVTGYTESSNFPTTPGAYNRTYQGAVDTGAVFATKLGPGGDALGYSTYIGTGYGTVIKVERQYCIDVDSTGSAYVGGSTVSSRFPTTPGALYTNYRGGSFDGFVTKLAPDGSALAYSTYLGGSDSDRLTSLAVSGTNAYVTGFTMSTNYPTTGGAYQTSHAADAWDTIVSKLNSAGSGLAYSTFIGSANPEEAYGIAVDSAGSAYTTGIAYGTTYPTTGGAYQTLHGGVLDAYLTKLRADGTGLVFSSFIGGDGSEMGYAVSVDSAGSAIVTGETSGGTFPTTSGGYDRTYNGGLADAFMAKFNAAGSGLSHSTFLGGSNQEKGFWTYAWSTRDVFVTGMTFSNNYPTTAGAFDRTLDGSPNGYVTRLVFSNNAPTANAGPDFSAPNKLRADLDGTLSSDPDGDFLYYRWSQISGPPTAINDVDNATAWILPMVLGTYEFRLTVTDCYGASSSDNVIVTVVNNAPIANAGPDAVDYRNKPIYLDGSGSNDPNGDSLSYLWNQTAGPNYPTINGLTIARPWFVASVLGMYTFNLNVTDVYGAWSVDTVSVSVVNRAPVADAGVNHSGVPNTWIILDGSASYDPDGDPLTYNWVKLIGPAITMRNTTEKIAYMNSSIMAQFKFQLEVRDPFALWTLDWVNVSVGNAPPIADAGPDQFVPKNSRVDLDGSGSNDPGGVISTYSWKQIGGPGVTLNNPNTVGPWFVPMAVGGYTFELNVTDNGGLTGVDTVFIDVFNRPPTANAGPDAGASKHALVTLNGSQSSDPDKDVLNFSWVKIGGPSTTLSDPTNATPIFTPDVSGLYAFNLTVRDGDGEVAWDEVVITVVNRDPVADAGMDKTAPITSLVTLDASGSTDPDNDMLTYLWKQTGGVSVIIVGDDTAVAAFIPTVTGVYTFRVNVTDNEGAMSSDNVTITAAPGLSPVPDIKVWPGLFGQPSSTFVFDASNSTDPDGFVTGYHWDFGDSATDARAKAPHSYSSAQVFTVKLTVTDNDGMTNWTTVRVTVATGRPPVPDIKVWPGLSGQLSTVFVFDAFNSTDPDGFVTGCHWDFGDSTTATQVKVAHTYPASQVFTVKLTVTDNDGNSNWTTVKITIATGAPPIADIKVWPSFTGYVGTVFVFDGLNSTDPDGTVTEYLWDFGDGGMDVRGKTDHMFSSKGQFTVTLQVTDNLGNTDTAVVQIDIVNRPPDIIARIPSSPSMEIVTGGDQTFAVVASDLDGDTLGYVWRLDGAQVCSDSPACLFNKTEIATYVVNVTVSDGTAQAWAEWTISVRVAGGGGNGSPDGSAFPWWIIIVVLVVVVLIVLLFMMKTRRKSKEPAIPTKPPTKAPPAKTGTAKAVPKPGGAPSAKPPPKPAAKSTMKTTAAPTAKPAPKAAPKPPAKPVTKAPPGPVPKPAIKPPPAKPPAASAIPPAAAPPVKPVLTPAAEPAPAFAAKPAVTPPLLAPTAQVAIPLMASSIVPAPVPALMPAVGANLAEPPTTAVPRPLVKPAAKPEAPLVVNPPANLPAMVTVNPEVQSAVVPVPERPDETPGGRPAIPAKKEMTLTADGGETGKTE